MHTQKTVLLVDNMLDFLDTRATYLEMHGYEVIKASGPVEAKQILQSAVKIDAAILDIRLLREDDPKDTSGITLAKEILSVLPKIVLTGHILSENILEALRPNEIGDQVMPDLVFKEDPEYLVQLLDQILKSKKIFIVHGRNTDFRHVVAGFLEDLGIPLVILDQQDVIGSPILLNLENYSDVDAALVLMTADDVGCLKSDNRRDLKPRARQNVVLELGYFIGKLGHEKVFVLYDDGVEMPSDYAGVVYIPHDAHEGWKLKLGQKLKYAGFHINPAKLF